MKLIPKVTIVILLVLFSSIAFYNHKIQKENNQILSDAKISSTDNLEYITSTYSLPPTYATRLYAFALWYRFESVKSRLKFAQKIDLPENYIFCADKRIVNLVLPYIYKDDTNTCIYNQAEDETFSMIKTKFENSERFASIAKQNNPLDFSGKDPTKWFQENSIVPPVTPYAGQWETFSLDLNILNKFTPPVFGSPEDFQEIEKVKTSMQNATPEQKQKVEYWAAGKGSATPLGLWLSVVDENYLEHTPAIRILQIKKDISLTAYDSVIACWNLKYKFMTKRPFMRDDKIVSQIMTPNFPSYPSGHATMSSSIATVLENKYPINDQKGKFYKLAEEAANSRLWGGIHFDIDNQDGLKIGKIVGKNYLNKN